MRHYAEIGCLTLLGFTLTIYAAQYDQQEKREVPESTSVFSLHVPKGFHVRVSTTPVQNPKANLHFLFSKPIRSSASSGNIKPDRIHSARSLPLCCQYGNVQFSRIVPQPDVLKTINSVTVHALNSMTASMQNVFIRGEMRPLLKVFVHETSEISSSGDIRAGPVSLDA